MSMQPDGASSSIQIVIPIFNDWAALRLLLPALDAALGAAALSAAVLVVDDGSHVDPELPDLPLASVKEVRVLRLRRNLGHQRAIAIGLAYVDVNLSPDITVVMDGDGEDAPADVPRLVQRLLQDGGTRAIFARRKKRAEGLPFRIFYQLYKAAHRILVGRAVRVGNFSAIPGSQLHRLVAVSDLWNHYAAAFMRARLPHLELDTHRMKRLDGSSKMNTVSLVTHGLSAISVYSETVGTRLLAATGGLALVSFLGILGVVGIRLFSDLAIPGWATYTLGFLALSLMQSIFAGFFFTFMTLANRNHMTVAPCHDFEKYILDVRVWGRSAAD